MRYIVTVSITATKGAITVVKPDGELRTHMIRSEIDKWQDSTHVRSLVENFMLMKYPEVVGKMHGSTEQWSNHTILSSVYTFYVDIDSEPLVPGALAVRTVLRDAVGWKTTWEVHNLRCRLQEIDPDATPVHDTRHYLTSLYINGEVRKGGMDTGTLIWKLR